ncbi:HAD family hydrolase [Vibrio sp. 10N]|uniref:HAD family hydrolase n=1 Tax=Vibrio sp. 10N TaxID=3058938 RepID=UPI002813E1F2|nr:HAD-IA family hydrolase [Vibrio sp. 10N]
MIKAVVFDLDNTLVTSNINFQQLRLELACPADKDLLTHVDETFCDTERQQRIETILKHELDDAEASDLMAGARSLTDWLSNEGLRFGIITRNCREAAKKKLTAHALTIEELITREDFPAKPDPSALLHLVDKWQLEQHNVLYVGDHQYDILTAQNAGCLSCFISNSSQTPDTFGADLHYSSLDGLLTYLQESYLQESYLQKGHL